MKLEELLEKIEMPEPMILLLEEKERELSSRFPGSFFESLYREIEESEDGWKQVAFMKEQLPSDEEGIGLLWMHMKLAFFTREEYQKKGISSSIFFDTMKFYSRTAREEKIRFDRWCFKTEEWGFRQLTLKIFRLGSLEFEMLDDLELVEAFLQGPRYVSIHIPGDADLEEEARFDAYCRAKVFLKNYFPLYKDAPIICYSWLMSPELKKLLPDSSRILDFQNDFLLSYTDLENTSYVKWVFQTNDPDPRHFKEETGLQKKMKNFISEGGKIGIGAGPLKKSRLDQC